MIAHCLLDTVLVAIVAASFPAVGAAFSSCDHLPEQKRKILVDRLDPCVSSRSWVSKIASLEKHGLSQVMLGEVGCQVGF